MVGERSTKALARIDAALARIDAAAREERTAPSAPAQDNSEAIARIKSEVEASIAQIDQILARSGAANG